MIVVETIVKLAMNRVLLHMKYNNALTDYRLLQNDLKADVAMGVRRKFSRGGQSRHFAYPFQVADAVMQIDVHKTHYPFYTSNYQSDHSTISAKLKYRYRIVV